MKLSSMDLSPNILFTCTCTQELGGVPSQSTSVSDKTDTCSKDHGSTHLKTPPTAPPPPPATHNIMYDRMLQKSAEIICHLAAVKCSGVLADKLRSKKLIADTTYEQGTNFGPEVVESTRVRSMINAVLAKVKVNPEIYDRLVETLREIGGLEDLVQLL